MGRFICHHEGQFFEWSTVCDGPVTHAMNREEFDAYYRDEYGRRAFELEYPARMARALKKGTSSFDDSSLRDLVASNRAGPRDGKLSFKAIIALVNEPPEDDE